MSELTAAQQAAKDAAVKACMPNAFAYISEKAVINAAEDGGVVVLAARAFPGLVRNTVGAISTAAVGLAATGFGAITGTVGGVVDMLDGDAVDHNCLVSHLLTDSSKSAPVTDPAAPFRKNLRQREG